MKIASCIIALIVLIVGTYFYWRSADVEPAAAVYKNITYTIEAKKVTLTGPIKYFGNEIHKDLNGDGKEDVAFLVTSQPGGSGTFYYVVAAIATDRGYMGSPGFLLGDRIAPQTSESGPGQEIIVNYADRKLGEPFTTPPSVSKSVYLLLDPVTLQWKRAGDTSDRG
jgi:hypothetical protein